MHDLLTVLQQLPPLLVYVVAAVLVAGETAVIFGLLVPAEATLLLVGFLAYAGTLRLVPAMIVMVAAGAVGDSLAFRSGRRLGPALRGGRWGTRVGEQRWARADAMINRLGGRGILAARWVAFIRTLAPRLAGGAGMPYRRFLAWNLAGVLSWVGSAVLVGYLAGESYQRVSALLGDATGAVLALVGCIVVLVLIGRWLGRNPDPVRALAARVGRLPPLSWLTRRYGALFLLTSRRIGAGWTLVINLVVGLGLLLGVGLVLAWLVGALVRHSGLSRVDGVIAAWFADRRTAGTVDVALGVLSVLRGPFLILAVTLLTLALGGRAGPHRWHGPGPAARRASRTGDPTAGSTGRGPAGRTGGGVPAGSTGGGGPAGTTGGGAPVDRSAGAGTSRPAATGPGPARQAARRGDLVGVLGAAGAFVPLLLLAVVADLTQPDRGGATGERGPVTLFPTQNAVVAASLCTMAWLVARRSPWPVAVAAWTSAAVGIATVATARLYLGWSTATETVASVLLGVLWTVVFIVAWATRDRALAGGRLPRPVDRAPARDH